MKTRNFVIITLLVIGIILFGVVQGIVIPQNERSQQKYILDQKDPLTHDFKSIIKYKNKYMGNASNLINLFHSLPLNDVGMSFQLYPDTFTAEVDYKETVWGIGKDKVDRALIYNATAAFILIDNLKAIDFNFTGASFKVSRESVEKWYDTDLSSLFAEAAWKNKVQSRMQDGDYVLKCTKAIIQKGQ